MHELLEQYCEQKNITRFEGDSGVASLHKICAALGYSEDNYKYGSPIEKFLADNSGAIEMLLDWISEQEMLLDELDVDPCFDSVAECMDSGRHLESCDDDGYCNFCGEQESDED